MMRTPSTKCFGLGLGVALGLFCFACSEGSEEGGNTGGGTATGGGDTGGSTGSGGAETGGAGGEGGVAPTATVLYTFATSDEDFELQDYDSPGVPVEPDNPEQLPYVNLYECCLTPQNDYCTWTDPANTAPAFCPEITASQHSELGFDGTPGVLLLNVPFTAYDQSVDVQKNLATAQDMTGKTLRVKVKVVSGFAPDMSAPGGGYINVKTGADWAYGRGPWQNILPNDFGDWVEFWIDLDAPEEPAAGFDPAEVVSIGIQLSVGSGGSSTLVPLDTVAYIDHITIE